MIPLRFTVADVDAAAQAWGCNCGPAALAAIAGLTLDQVRPLLPDFARRGYVNPTMMFDALERAGLPFEGRALGRRVFKVDFPRRGLARIQWGGPWCKPGVPPAAAYGHTHWIAAELDLSAGGLVILDVNTVEFGWISASRWSTYLVPELTRAIPRADGKWHITHAIEVP